MSVQRIQVANKPSELMLFSQLSGEILLWREDEQLLGGVGVKDAEIRAVLTSTKAPLGGLSALFRTALQIAGGGKTQKIRVKSSIFQGLLRSLDLPSSFSFDEIPESFQRSEVPLSLLLRGERLILPETSSIFQLGAPAEGLFVVLRGSVRLVGLKRNGEPGEIALLGPGSFFGEESLQPQQRYRVHALALAREVDLLQLKPQTLSSQEDQCWLQDQLLARLRNAIGRVLDGEEEEARDRLVQILLDLGERALRRGERAECDLRWLATQAGLLPSRLNSLLSPYWMALHFQHGQLYIDDLSVLKESLGGASGGSR